MGDDLAELLYGAWCARAYAPLVVDMAWSQLSDHERGLWENVAAKAREELTRRFVRDMRDATVEYGAAQAIENLLSDNPTPPGDV